MKIIIALSSRMAEIKSLLLGRNLKITESRSTVFILRPNIKIHGILELATLSIISDVMVKMVEHLLGELWGAVKGQENTVKMAIQFPIPNTKIIDEDTIIIR
ncbi:hypothetical protein L9F63_001446, partial [Diploptera punctata]